MKTDVGKSFIVCLCVLITSSSCFQEHYEEVTTKEKGPLGNNVHRERISSTSESWQYSSNTERLYGFDLIHLFIIVQTIENNWWIILLATLLPYFLAG